MADDQMDGASVLAGLPAINAAVGQSTIGAFMSPEQIADVDWGEAGPPDLGPGPHTLLKRWDEPVSGPVLLGSTNGQETGGPAPTTVVDAGDDTPPWTVTGQDPGLVPPGGAPSVPMAEDQVDPEQPVVVAQAVPALPPKSLLDQISKSEGTGDTNSRSGYDTIYGYGQTPKPLSQMTLDEVRQQQDQMDGPTPVGRYQINKGTLGDLQNKLGLSDDTVFSPEVQDQMAQQLMAQRGKWKDFINGQISADQFGQNVSGTWSSLQKPDNMAQFQSVLSQVPRNN
jgi:muramidase (phage lysozyme)